MSLADQPAFPKITGDGRPLDDESGMTYRQWLVGIFGGGVAANNDGALTVNQVIDKAIQLADAAIRAQEK